MEAEKQDQVRQQLYEQIETDASIQINDSVCHRSMDMYTFDTFKITDEGLKTQKIYEQFKPLFYDTLAKYLVNGIPRHLTVGNVVTLYSQRIMLPVLINPTDLTDFIHLLIREEYLLQFADSLKLEKEEKFIFDKINYKNKAMLGFYEHREVRNRLVISQKEIENEFNRQKKELMTAETAAFSIYTFTSREDAFSAMIQLKRQETGGAGKTEMFNGFVDFKTMTIDWETKKYPPEILAILFDLPLHQVSAPINTGNNFLIAIKSNEKGNRVKPLEAVRMKIKAKLEYEKYNSIKKIVVQRYRQRHAIRINSLRAETRSCLHTNNNELA